MKRFLVVFDGVVKDDAARVVDHLWINAGDAPEALAIGQRYGIVKDVQYNETREQYVGRRLRTIADDLLEVAGNTNTSRPNLVIVMKQRGEELEQIINILLGRPRGGSYPEGGSLKQEIGHDTR